MDYIARAYFRYNDMRYRITVFEQSVWVERQTPYAFAGNQQMAAKPDEILYGAELWIVEAIPALLDEYERLIVETVR